MGLNDEATHSGGHNLAYTFRDLPDLIAAGRIPKEEVEKAAAAVEQAIKDKKSASEILTVASTVLTGVLGMVKPF